MTPENFCYWLQGLLELGDQQQLDEKQTTMVREHLSFVFRKLAPVTVTQEKPPPVDFGKLYREFYPGETIPLSPIKYC